MVFMKIHDFLRFPQLFWCFVRKLTSKYLRNDNEYVCFQPGIRKESLFSRKARLLAKITFLAKKLGISQESVKMETFCDPCPLPPRDGPKRYVSLGFQQKCPPSFSEIYQEITRISWISSESCILQKHACFVFSQLYGVLCGNWPRNT